MAPIKDRQQLPDYAKPTADKIDRLVTALSQQEAEQGLGDTDGPAPPSA